MPNFNWSKLLTIVFCFLVLIYCLFFDGAFLPQDQAMYLYAGRLILEGQIPFRDFFDINPPLIMYLNAGIVSLSDLMQINSIAFFKGFVLVVEALLLLFGWSFFQRAYQSTKESFITYWRLCTLAIIIQIAYFNFGQRDDLFAVSLIAYLLLKCARIVNTEGTPRFSVPILITSIFVGVTACLKPHFFLHLLVAEIFTFFYLRKSRRSFWSLELIISFTLPFIYLAWLLYMPEPAFSYFWKTHISEVREFYDSFNIRKGDQLMGHILMVTPLIAVMTALFVERRRLSLPIQLFTLQGFASLLVVLLQRKLWIYHFSMTLFVSIFLIFFYFIDFFNAPERKHRLIFSLLAAALLITAGYRGARFLNLIDAPEIKFATNLERTLAKVSKPGQCAISLSAVPRTSFPAFLNLGLKNCSRYLFQYKLSFFGNMRDQKLNPVLKGEDVARYLRLEEKYFSELKEDVQKFNPDLIYYYTYPGSRQNLPYDFPIDQYFGSYGFFQSLEEDYTKMKIGMFQIFVRKGSEGIGPR